MWFASIWIFTLRLPWALGAEFFRQHLLDADAASNTLSWRWVAGIQTPGKHYLARAENIARHTNGRFDPRGELDEDAAPLDEPGPPPASPLPPADALPEGPVALLLHEDDLHPESLPQLRVMALAGVLSSAGRAPAARAFTEAALADGLALFAQHLRRRLHAQAGEHAVDLAVQVAQAHHHAVDVQPGGRGIHVVAGAALQRLRQLRDAQIDGCLGLLLFRASAREEQRQDQGRRKATAEGGGGNVHGRDHAAFAKDCQWPVPPPAQAGVPRSGPVVLFGGKNFQPRIHTDEH
jgi:hypothetical protein